MHFFRHALILASLFVFPIIVSAQGLDTAKIDQAIGKSGQKMGEVYKFGFPRSDLHVSVHGLAIKPGLALGSWAAFMGSDNDAMVMGDLVLLEDELNPVMAKLRSSDFEISAVHNHLIDETPHVVYMHYMGHGVAAQIAASLRAALTLSKTPIGPAAASAVDPTPPSWVQAVEGNVGRKGTLAGGVLSYGIARADSIMLGGMTIAPAAGVAEAINFQEATPGNVATAGDFVLIADEVNPVISELQAHHILVTGVHSHMLREQPRLFFMHFWGVGTPESVGAGIAAALKHISVK